MVTHDQEEALTMADRIVVMNQGVIEQVGTPLEIYREPATAFVADFIGTMNFVTGTMTGPNRVCLGRVELACDADAIAEGTEVTIALRPEDILAQGVQAGDENSLELEVREMEFLGSFYRADLGSKATGRETLKADFSINLVRRQDMTVGDLLTVALPRARIRIYPAAQSDG